MLTDADTTKLVNRIIEVQKDLFYTKPEMDGKFDNLREDFSKLQTAVASFASGTKENADEIKVVNNRVTNQENWIQKVAPKVGVEYKV